MITETRTYPSSVYVADEGTTRMEVRDFLQARIERAVWRGSAFTLVWRGEELHLDGGMLKPFLLGFCAGLKTLGEEAWGAL